MPNCLDYFWQKGYRYFYLVTYKKGQGANLEILKWEGAKKKGRGSTMLNFNFTY